MNFLDKIKDLFSDEIEVVENKEIEVEEREEHKLPTFMRNKIEEEQEREERKSQNADIRRTDIDISDFNLASDRETVKTRSNNFSFPMEMDDDEPLLPPRYSSQNVLERQEKKPTPKPYGAKEEVKPKRFKPTPVISPVYGVLDKNYTKDEIKVQDESSYEIQRPSRKIDFETVRNKAFGTLTDDIKNNLCENCELYQEVKITKNADKDLLADIREDNKDVSIGDAEDNYFDFGVSYEPPKKEIVEEPVVAPSITTINIDELEITNEIKIVNHNEEESKAEKIELNEEIKETPKKETKRTTKKESKEVEKELEDTKEFEKLTHDEEDIVSILNEDDDIPLVENNDIFGILDSMYNEEEK